MKKLTFSGLGVFLRSSYLRFCNLQTRLRLTALSLILTLLIPCFIFNPLRQISAQTRFPAQDSAPVSAPPLPFGVSSSESKVQSLLSAATETATSVGNFFTAPELPEGFENARTSSQFSKSVSSVGSVLSSIFTQKVSAASNLPLSQPLGSVEFDFDGDDKADLSRWRGSALDWQIKQSSNVVMTNLSIGSTSAAIAPGDFDGDGKTDRAVFNAGTWTIKRSSDSATQTISFGTSGDKPVTGDYDGDGRSDAAVFRASTNTWLILNSSNDNSSSTSFGNAGDITAQGNYDGDNKTDLAVFRPSTGDWHIQGSLAGYFTLHWGITSDIPVPADFDGDSKTDCAVYRGSTGTWYVYKSSTNNGEYILQTWGNYGDQPVPADYDGDNKADFSVFRPTTGVWHIIKSANGTYDYQTLGMAGDVAVSSAYLKQIGGTVFGYDLARARLAPKNATGGTNLYSQNFAWGTGLVGLSGRAGMDAGFGISYNSLVWTKDAVNNTVVFDADGSNISPGFRFGFPTIEPTYYNSLRRKFSYLMVMPSGARVEFNQIGASEFYETADSAYAQLKTIGASDPNTPIENISILVTTTDGGTMTYEWKAGAFRCSQIKDRNGNFISINHDAQGVLRTVTDTLGRIITVNYDSQLDPVSITQTWKNNNGQGADVTHTYASFTYTTISINTNFQDLTVIGPPNGTNLKVLEKITFAGGGAVKFYHQPNSYGQVYKIENLAADSHILNYVSTDIDTPPGNPSDCPRFTLTRSMTENFNGGNEIIIHNSVPVSESYTTPAGSGTAAMIRVWMENDPYGAETRSFVGSSGWQEGLPIVSEDLVTEGSLVRKRWTWTNWTQDDISKSYILNPRVIESRVGDTTNIKKTEIDYRLLNANISEYGLVSEVRLFDGSNNVLQKKSTTEYNLNAAYVSRRIIGLPAQTESWGLNQIANQLEKVSKVTFAYDEGDLNNSLLGQNIAPIQHDNTNFAASFVTGRGNLTSTTRHDVSGLTANVTTSVKYNTAGAAVEQTDPLNRKVEISYTDAFNDNQNRNSFAYPTKLTEVANTDTSNNYSSVKYRFDTGANVWAKSPGAAGNPNGSGKETAREFDAIGRLQKETLVNTGAYTRYEYAANNIQSKVFLTVIDTNNNGADSNDEVLAEAWTDGAGRVLRARTAHPGSSGEWAGTITEYDILGRVVRSSVPTEILVPNPLDPNSWQAAGDDLTRGFLWKHQKYDWKGRVVRIINTDGVDSPVLNASDQLFSYDGCGCAGGQITTVQGELVPVPGQTYSARRTQKVYADILGRNYKTEVLNWDNSVYTTNLAIFNGRDQALSSIQYAGTTSSLTFQTTTATYDGHGRLKTQHLPQQNANTATTYAYNSDDTVLSVTDARGASTNYSYNTRGLLGEVSYSVPANSNIPDPSNVTFSYDAVGNRTNMTDGLGNVVYEYNGLSQMTVETRQFNDTLANAPLPNNRFRLEYSYTLAGQLKSLKDPFGDQINYAFDKVGRLDAVTGTTYGGITTYANNTTYRAWNGLKSLAQGNGTQTSVSYNNRLQSSAFTMTRNTQAVMQKNYEYYADGSLKYIADQLNPKFDRLNIYDHAGRIKEAKSGAEARGETVTTNQNENLPYRQSYQFNEFGNLTQRNNLHWGTETWQGQSNNLTYTYQNNRITNLSWYHDADGRVTQSGLPNADTSGSHYDAAGQLVKLETHLEIVHGRGEIERILDGDGRELKRKKKTWLDVPIGNGYWQLEADIYYIRSSVLGGEVVSETTSTGRKRKTYIQAEGSRLAWQAAYFDEYNIRQESVYFEHQDASGMSVRTTTSDGTQMGGVAWEGAPAELDAMGGNIGTTTPYIEEFPSEPPSPFIGGIGEESPMSVNGKRVTCNMDGMAVFCNVAFAALSNGSAVQCPGNDCSPRKTENGWFFFRAFNDGYSGYMPIGANYVGGGQWRIPRPRKPPTLKRPSKEEQRRKRAQMQLRGITSDQTERTIIPLSNIDKIREGLALVWQNSDCRQLIQDILGAVSTKGNPILENGDITKLFDLLLKQRNGGLMRSGVNPGAGASAHGTLTNGDGIVSLGGCFWCSENQQTIADIMSTIAELIHLAGKNKAYSDKEFAEVVKNNPLWASSNWQDNYFKIPQVYPDNNPTYTPAQKKLLGRDELPYSGYWHPVVDNLCLSKIDWSKLF